MATVTTWIEGAVMTLDANDVRLAEQEEQRVWREIIDYDQGTGVFRWRNDRSWRIKAGSIAGSQNKDGYRYIGFGNRLYKAHRVAWLLTFGEWPNGDIDHINGARDDNRICNLRIVSKSGNRQNLAAAHKSSRSGLLGVSADKKRWRAVIHVDGKQRFVGSFETKEQAHAAYLTAKEALHPFSARTGPRWAP